jgi:hypothetical protein
VERVRVTRLRVSGNPFNLTIFNSSMTALEWLSRYLRMIDNFPPFRVCVNCCQFEKPGSRGVINTSLHCSSRRSLAPDDTRMRSSLICLRASCSLRNVSSPFASIHNITTFLLSAKTTSRSKSSCMPMTGRRELSVQREPSSSRSSVPRERANGRRVQPLNASAHRQ